MSALKGMLEHYVRSTAPEELDPAISKWLGTGKRPSMRSLLTWILDQLVVEEDWLGFVHEQQGGKMRDENTPPRHHQPVEQPKQQLQQPQAPLVEHKQQVHVHARKKGSKATATPASPAARAEPPAPPKVSAPPPVPPAPQFARCSLCP